jgi:cell division protein FtsB
MSVIWQQTTHGVPRRRGKANRLLARLFIYVAIVLTILAGGYLALIATNVRLSREVWQMYEELAEIRRESEFIRTDIAKASSIPVLQKRSVELGYRPTDAGAVEYINVGSQ